MPANMAPKRAPVLMVFTGIPYMLNILVRAFIQPEPVVIWYT
jgi:hypothetical protein